MRFATGVSYPDKPATEMIDFRKGRISLILIEKDPKGFRYGRTCRFQETPLGSHIIHPPKAVGEGGGVLDGVCVGVKVGVFDGVRVGVLDGVIVSVGVSVAEGVKEAVGVAVAVRVGVSVDVGVMVLVKITGVRLRVGVGEMRVSVMVGVCVAVARVSGAKDSAINPAQ